MEFHGSKSGAGRGRGSSSKRPGGGFWWKALVVLLVLAAILAVIAVKSSKSARGRRTARPESPVFPPTEVVATVNGEPITVEDVRLEFYGLPQVYQSQYRNQMHEFLEEVITRKLLLQESKRLEVAETPAYKELLSGHSPHPGHEEEVLINALLRTEVLGRVNVTEEDLAAFYEEHKARIPAGLPYDMVKESLRNSLMQQKSYEALEQFIADLWGNAQVSRNERWVEAQKALTAANPLDRALATGRPVVADFGKGECIPCKMMKPILDDLAIEYRGKAEILIIEMDDYPFLARRCGVRVIPTQIFYDSSGNEVYRHQGFMPKEQIREQLAKLGVK
jgi:thioredoxin 1